MNYNHSPKNAYNVSYYQQKFLEHSAHSEHYARLKMTNASQHDLYYKYAELEYYHKSRAIHYKGLFSAESTRINY